MTKKRNLERERALQDLRQQLLKAKQQVKIEFEQNTDLIDNVQQLESREHEQGQLLSGLDQEMTSIRDKLADYELTTRLKDDQTKF